MESSPTVLVRPSSPAHVKAKRIPRNLFRKNAYSVALFPSHSQAVALLIACLHFDLDCAVCDRVTGRRLRCDVPPVLPDLFRFCTLEGFFEIEGCEIGRDVI